MSALVASTLAVATSICVMIGARSQLQGSAASRRRARPKHNAHGGVFTPLAPAGKQVSALAKTTRAFGPNPHSDTDSQKLEPYLTPAHWTARIPHSRGVTWHRDPVDAPGAADATVDAFAIAAFRDALKLDSASKIIRRIGQLAGMDADTVNGALTLVKSEAGISSGGGNVIRRQRRENHSMVLRNHVHSRNQGAVPKRSWLHFFFLFTFLLKAGFWMYGLNRAVQVALGAQNHLVDDSMITMMQNLQDAFSEGRGWSCSNKFTMECFQCVQLSLGQTLALDGLPVIYCSGDNDWMIPGLKYLLGGDAETLGDALLVATTYDPWVQAAGEQVRMLCNGTTTWTEAGAAMWLHANKQDIDTKSGRRKLRESASFALQTVWWFILAAWSAKRYGVSALSPIPQGWNSWRDRVTAEGQRAILDAAGEGALLDSAHTPLLDEVFGEEPLNDDGVDDPSFEPSPDTSGDTASGDTASTTASGDTASGDTASGDTASGEVSPVRLPHLPQVAR